MPSKTDDIQRIRPAGHTVDPTDRKILAALVEDGSQSYAKLGAMVHLSAPAVFERVKRLRARGHLGATTVALDGPGVGKPLLAFVQVDTQGWGKSKQMLSLSHYPEVEEIHSVAGDTCALLKVRVKDTAALEAFLAQVYALPAVKGTRSYVVLSTFLERPVQAGVTEGWPDPFEEDDPRVLQR